MSSSIQPIRSQSQRISPYFNVAWLPTYVLKGLRVGVTGDFVVNENLESELVDGANAPFGAIQDWAESLDLLILTLDATFPGDDPKPSGPHVVTGSATLRALPRAKHTLLNLGNNHAFDMGLSGYRGLRREADLLGFVCVGAGETTEEAEAPWVEAIDGITIAVHSAAHHGCHPRAPLSCGAQVADVASETWRDGIARSAGEGRAAIVLVHGGLEHCQYPSPAAMEISRDLAGRGAAAVIWSHAHVVQGGERFGGVPIAYGLGNAYYPALTGDPKMPNTSDPRYDRGLFLELSVQEREVTGGHALAVVRTGLDLHFDSNVKECEAEQVRVSRMLGSRFYPLFFRFLRLWEDVFLHTWRYFRRDSFWLQLRRLNLARVRGLLRCFRNVRSDAEDV